MNKILHFTKDLNRKAVNVNKKLTARFVGIHCHMDCLLMKYGKLTVETRALQVNVPKKKKKSALSSFIYRRHQKFFSN